MGMYDIPAMLETIVDVSGNEKVSYVGLSQGSTQMFYVLAKNEDRVAHMLDRAIMLGPCIIGESTLTAEDYEKIFSVWKYEGINLINSSVREYEQQTLCEPWSIEPAFTEE